MPWVEIPYGSLLALLEPPHDLAPTVWALTQCVAEHFSFRDPERIPEGGRVSSILAFRVQNGRLPGPRAANFREFLSANCALSRKLPAVLARASRTPFQTWDFGVFPEGFDPPGHVLREAAVREEHPA